MTSSLLISCDAFAALFVVPAPAWRAQSWLAPARLGPAEHDPRAVATCHHPRFLRAETALAEDYAARGTAPAAGGRREDAA